MKPAGDVSLAECETRCAEQLARFFPQAVPIHVPVQVVALRSGARSLTERTILEYRAGAHVIFVCNLPFEFDDRLRLEVHGSEAALYGAVIALRYHDGTKAVAVRLDRNSEEWTV